jgi:hypothetical protein
MTRDLRVVERFWAKVDLNGPLLSPYFSQCWLWTDKRTPDGYARFRDGKRTIAAHRFTYELLRGPIAKGLVSDHLCRVKHCVNPFHIEPVTDKVNVLRGIGLTAKQAKQTHCIHGHEFSPRNTYMCEGKRHCRACKAARERRRRVERRTTA